jgi:hypothetical protein
MYKLCLSVFLSIPLLSTAQIKFLIETGAFRSTFASGPVKSSSEITDTKAVWTLGIRALIEKPVSGSLCFVTGISYDTKGSRFMRSYYANIISERDIFIDYLVVPVGVSGKLPLGKHFLSLGMNIYLARPLRGYEIGISATTTTGVYSYGYIYNRIEIRSANNSPGQLHPTLISDFDYGAEASAQVHIKKFRLGVKCTRGFTGVLANGHLYDRQYYNSGIGLTVGYRL